MKLISLNIWRGKQFKPLINFLKTQSKDTDIFCLQEVFDNPPGSPIIGKEARLNIYSEIKEALPNFEGHHNLPAQENEEIIVIFTRNSIEVKKINEVYIYRSRNSMVNNDPTTLGINVQYIQFKYNAKNFTICNLHGHWVPNYKGDNPARLEQSENLNKFLDNIEGAKVVCGDFNLAPDTKSMLILEKNMTNLIKKYGVTTTRNHFYNKPDKFADYILISPEVNIKDFKVLQDTVSDHLPLLIEFD